MPSQSYYNLAGSYFGEFPKRASFRYSGTWDINKNGTVDDAYTHNQFTSLFNSIRFPETMPSQTNSVFHNREGQDDWRQDQTGVEYSHIYGVQYGANTIGRVVAAKKMQFTDSKGNAEEVDTFFVQKVSGDETVPEISASRIGNSQNLNEPGAKLIPFKSNKYGDENDKVEHTGLTQNTEVHNKVLSILRASSQSQSSFQMKDDDNAEVESQINQDDRPESYFVEFLGVQNLIVANETGRNTAPIESSSVLALYESLPGVTINHQGYNPSVQLPGNSDSTEGRYFDSTNAKYFELTFQSVGKPIQIDIGRSYDNSVETQTQITRYLDLNYPAGTTFKLKLTSEGFENLRYDGDGDGEFESTITPDAFAEGEAAKDGTPPAVSFASEVQVDKQKVTITAQDEAGVKIVRYSLTGTKFQPYTTPLLVDPAQTPKIFVIADDNVGNRSGVYSFDVPPIAPPPTPTLAVIPILECVDENGNGTFIAKFGYDNKNAGSVTIPVGEDNKINPAPHDQGQTTNFQNRKN